MFKVFIKNFFGFKKRHFLVLLQNNNELRSTGGYITSVFDIELGKFEAKKKSLNVNTDLYDHKKVDAPTPIQKMLYDSHLNTWTFRDANYYPDFKKSGEKLVEFYNLVYPNNDVCSLLAINYSFVEDLLGIIGKVKVKDRTIDKYSLFTFLSAEASDIDRHNADALNTRKLILSSLGKKIIIKTILQPWKWHRILKLVSRGYSTRDLQMYEPNKTKLDFAPEDRQDFLAVIENNYLGLKSNRYIRRSVFHDSYVDTDNGVSNELKVMWEHFGKYDYPLSGKYKSHIRFYLPNGANITSSNVEYLASEEDGLSVIHFRLYLDPKEKSEINIKYDLPKDLIKEGNYKFKFFKQSGVKNELLRKAFSITNGFSFDKEIKENTMFKDITDVQEDCNFNIKFNKNNNHPRIFSHNIIDGETILIRFNEEISLKENSVSVYEKDNTDKKIDIESAKLDNGKDLYIKLKNLPSAYDKFYTVELKYIFNKNGISIHPNPKMVTVVYRIKA